MPKLAEAVVKNYGDAYPELEKNKKIIYDNLTREEVRFHRTVESGMAQLDDFIKDMNGKNLNVLDGEHAFELYATHGLPLELTRDILEERESWSR